MLSIFLLFLDLAVFLSSGGIRPTQALGIGASRSDCRGSIGIARLAGLTRHANVKVVFINFKLDEHGERIVHGDKHAAEIRAIGIHEFGEETKRVLKTEYDKAPLVSMLILSTLYGAGKLGIVKFQPVVEGQPIPTEAAYEEWEGKALVAYLDRHKL